MFTGVHLRAANSRPILQKVTGRRGFAPCRLFRGGVLNYSQVSIANVALQRIGARGSISSLQEDSPNAIKVNTCWDTIFQEVLSERDWKFAKNSNRPAGGYLFAYALPADFLRLCRPREKPQEHKIRYADYCGAGEWSGGSVGGWGVPNFDHPIWPRIAAPYIVATILNPGVTPTYSTNLLTNYPGLCVPYANVCPIIMSYIRLVTDMSQLLPGFVNCLANRLAAELSIPITEDKQKFQGMMQMYRDTLNSAQAQQECDDYLKDESGGNEWVTAGRYWGRGGYR